MVVVVGHIDGVKALRHDIGAVWSSNGCDVVLTCLEKSFYNRLARAAGRTDNCDVLDVVLICHSVSVLHGGPGDISLLSLGNEWLDNMLPWQAWDLSILLKQVHVS